MINHNFKADARIDMGEACMEGAGMGMPVIRSLQALIQPPPGGLTHVTNSQSWVEPDLNAWGGLSGNMPPRTAMEEATKRFFIQQTL